MINKITFEQNLCTSLPQGTSTYLTFPTNADADAFLLAVYESYQLHHPWVNPPSNRIEFDSYLQALDLERHIAFLVKTKSTHEIAGVINISEIVKGAFQSAYLGYYAFERFAGKGFMLEALSLTLDFYFNKLKLHRLEANVQPENHASIGLIKKLGFRREGFSTNYLNINGHWCDHERYAMTQEDYYG